MLAPPCGIQAAPAELELLAQTALQSPVVEARRNAVATLGLVEKWNKAQPEATHVRARARRPPQRGERPLTACRGASLGGLPLAQLCTRVFLAALSDADATVVATALNAVFDVFADTDKNAALAAADGLTLLKQAHAALKPALPQWRAKLARDEYGHLSDAVLNLKRFLVYKAKEKN